MDRILLIIEYKGTAYCGWQIQKGRPSVQQELVTALEKACGHKVKLQGSGRTDEGVHAMGQTAHFDTDCTIPHGKYPEAANIYLPDDIKILKSSKVGNSFHARYDAKRKTYLYKMYNSRVQSPLRQGLFAHIPYKLDINSMKEACRYLIGKQDFSAFMASGSEVLSPVREIYSAAIDTSGDEIYFEICGNGFLYNMVRIITGTLTDIGRGRFLPNDMKEIIGGKDRSKAGKTAPSCGLYLKSVEY